MCEFRIDWRRWSLYVALLCFVTLAGAACNDSASIAELDQQVLEERPSRIPAEAARLALADGQTQLRDFRLDAAKGVAYVTDSAYTLHVVSLDPLEVLASFETSGDWLNLDTANERLYIAPYDPLPDADAAVTVFDTAQQAVLWSVLGSRVSFDSANNRYYVGDAPEIGPRAVGDADALNGVRLYNGTTQQLLAQGADGGMPLFNPMRNELIVVNQGAVTVDPLTLERRADLFPEITAEPLPGCTGCRYVRNAWMLGERGPLAFDFAILPGGAGAGVEPGAVFYDAATLKRTDDRRSLGMTCSSLPVIIDAIEGGFLHHDWYSRYEVYNNLTVRGLTGATQVFKDGLGAPFVNPRTQAAYVPTWTGGNRIVDARTLAPLGVTAGWCPWALGDGGLVYAADGERHALLALAETGGSNLLPVAEPLPQDGLAGKSIKQIALSPNFGKDATILLVVTPPSGGDQVLRSTDAGATWTVIGGIPVGENLVWTMAISPDYAEDGTLFLGGARSTYAGEGVWRSQDGGDTWIPLWNGLPHLRVKKVEISPTYRDDGGVAVTSDYVQIVPWEQGESLHRSFDRGETWERVSTEADLGITPEPHSPFFLPDGSALPVRKVSYVDPIEVQDAAGGWTAAVNNLGANETLRALLPSPEYASDGTIYVVTDLAVYRTTDRGASWHRLDDARLTDLTWERLLTAATLSPVLGDGAYRLLLGTANGNIWQEDPQTLTWVDPGSVPAAPAQVPAATPAPVPTATLTADDAAAARATAVSDAQSQAAVLPSAETATAVTPTATTPTATTPTTVAPATAAPTTDPPTTAVAPEGLWGSRWAGDAALQEALGLALTREPQGIPAAYQFFEKGTMVWRSDTGKIYAILNDGTWQAYPDTFVEGEMERDPNIYTPGELLQPERGFGKVWREHASLKDTIGWGRAEEQGVTAQVQEFERGFAMRLSGLEYILLGDGDSGTWRN